MKTIIITIIMIAISISSFGQNTWSKEYDLGEGRKNFLRNLITAEEEGMIYISSWQFCPTQESNTFLECSVISNYNIKGDLITEIIYDSTAGVENGNTLILKECLLHISSLITDSLTNYYQIAMFDNNLNQKVNRVIEFNEEFNVNISGVRQIDKGVYIYGTLVNYDFSEENAFYAKLDDSLNIEIIKKYPARQLNVFMNDLQTTPDGNLAFILKQRGTAGPTGWAGYEIYKVDQNGEVIDSFVFKEGFGLDWPFSLTIDEEGNYYFFSDKHPINGFPASIGRVNKLNKDMKTLEWSVVLPNSTFGRQYRIEESLLAQNGDIIVCGSMQDFLTFENSPDHANSGFITRLDQEGNIIWHHIYKVPNDEYFPHEEYGRYRFSQLNKIVEMKDGSILAGGNHTYHWTVYDHPVFDDSKETNLLWLLKVDANGCLAGEECGEVIEIGKGFVNGNVSIGTTWTYEVKNHPAGKTQFKKYVIEDSIMWQGKLAYQLKPGLKGDIDYLYIDNDRYYFWDEDLNEYQLNYAFDERDSYETSFVQNGQSETALIIIDSVGQEMIDNQLIDVQYISTDFGVNNPVNLTIYKGIGASWSGPRLHIGKIYDNITDDVQKIRCFDDEITQLNFTDYPCDTIWQTLSTGNIDMEYPLNLYPNPAVDKFNISFPQEYVEFRIVDFNGKVWKYGKYTKGINIEEMPVGLYIVHVLDNKGQLLQSEKLLLVK